LLRLLKARIFGQKGVSLVELVAVSTIIVLLAALAVPVVSTIQRRHKELELRRALRVMRTAIDDYKRVFDVGINPQMAGNLNVRQECEGYPCELEDLVNGVDLGDVKERKVKFLRRVPLDPMTGKREWGLRSSKQDPDSLSWDNLHVFDVYTLSEGVDADGTAYSKW
jgi:general secretion pathway protein G